MWPLHTPPCGVGPSEELQGERPVLGLSPPCRWFLGSAGPRCVGRWAALLGDPPCPQ